LHVPTELNSGKLIDQGNLPADKSQKMIYNADSISSMIDMSASLNKRELKVILPLKCK
jgi:hypothetical protein